MISYKDLISIFNALRRKRLLDICEQAKQTFKEKGLLGLEAKIRKNHNLNVKGIILFDKKRNLFPLKRFRYVYIKIYSETSCRINLYWHANNQLYETDGFYIPKELAVYEFDIG